VALDELRSAGLLGLVQASKRFDPERGIAFGSYAQYWIKGQILELFKPKADAIGLGRAVSLNAPVNNKEDDDGATKLDLLPDEIPYCATIDVSKLSERERYAFRARLDGETLDNIANDIGISRERVRQINERAILKAGSTSGNVARACIRDLLDRRGYRKPARSEWAGRRFSPIKQIKITEHLSGPEKQWWLERLKNAETTNWSRKTDGREKRFKVDGSISWKELTPDEIERAKQKTPDEHLHKFLTHHQLERFRFDMRAKLCGGTKVNRPRKGPWCWASEPKPKPETGTVHVKRRTGGPCGGAIYYKPSLFGPSEKAVFCSEDSRRIVYHRFPFKPARQEGRP
jgi:RNA polymerase sigma factor (sigma-70 family)